MTAQKTESASLLKPSEGFSKPFLAVCAVAAFLCGAALAEAPTLLSAPWTTTSLAAEVVADPFWDCFGPANGQASSGTLEDAGIVVIANGNFEQNDHFFYGDITLKPYESYRVRATEGEDIGDFRFAIRGSPDNPNPGIDIYGFWIKGGFPQGEVYEKSPEKLVDGNSVKLINPPSAGGKVCGVYPSCPECFTPLVNGCPGGCNASALVSGIIGADIKFPPFAYDLESFFGPGPPAVIASVVAGPEKKLYSSTYYFKSENKEKSKKKKSDGASSISAVAGAICALLAAAAML